MSVTKAKGLPPWHPPKFSQARTRQPLTIAAVSRSLYVGKRMAFEDVESH